MEISKLPRQPLKEPSLTYTVGRMCFVHMAIAPSCVGQLQRKMVALICNQSPDCSQPTDFTNLTYMYTHMCVHADIAETAPASVRGLLVSELIVGWSITHSRLARCCRCTYVSLIYLLRFACKWARPTCPQPATKRMARCTSQSGAYRFDAKRGGCMGGTSWHLHDENHE